VEITRYIVGLGLLLVATLVALLSAHRIMLPVSSRRRRRPQQDQTAAAE
jgi:hypothetical protein